jgi:Short-chain dehydrogenases of various substrate specificities
MRTWLITGVSSGFGKEMAKQLLTQGDRVIGTVRNRKKVGDLIEEYPNMFDCKLLEMTDVPAIHRTVSETFEQYGKIDVIVSNAGYGLFGCAEELSDAEINHILATNLTGAIQFIRSSIPYLRLQGGGRILQLSSYGGQVAYPANSMYHATKFGIEGFCEAVAQEIEQFGIGMTIVEPGGARTEFRYGSAKIANLMPEYASCHGFLNMLDASKGLAPGDPAKIAARMIQSVEQNPAPLRIALGSQALKATIKRLEERLADYKKQTMLAGSTDIDVL